MKTNEVNENPRRAPLSALICEEAYGMNQKRTLSDEDDDDTFLSEVAAAAEAHALTYSKRYKSTSSAAAANFDVGKSQPQGGAYLAALRADDTPRLLQQQQQQRKNFISLPSRVKVVAADAAAGGDRLGFSADGSCFKCGRAGHWARDCDSGGTTGGGAVALSQSSEPDKACPCGVGNCVVLTANTEKNRGRKFYKCPLKEENGGCGFFQWCDSASEMTNTTTASSHSNFTTPFPNLSCPCGAGSCLILTAKTGNNAGRQFYRCPANQESSCGFFKWCNDKTAVVAGLPSSTNKGYENSFNKTNLRSYGTTSSLSCFKCGKEGHWAKDCPSSTNLSPGPVRNPSSSGSCYKCGNPGHWARDCPNIGQ